MFKNPFTTILGYIVIGLTWIQQIFISQEVPQTKDEWFSFVIKNVMGLVALFSKDFNKTNAVIPAETHTNTTTATPVVGLPASK